LEDGECEGGVRLEEDHHELFEHIMGYGSAAIFGILLMGYSIRRMLLSYSSWKMSWPIQCKVISPFLQCFLKIKNLCSEISMLDSEEPISESQMKRLII